MCLAVLDPWSWLVANEKWLHTAAASQAFMVHFLKISQLVNRGRPQLMNVWVENISSWPWLTRLVLAVPDGVSGPCLWPSTLEPYFLLVTTGAHDGPVNYCGEGTSFCRCWHDISNLHSFIHTSINSTNVMCQALCWAQEIPGRTLLCFLSLEKLAMGNCKTAEVRALPENQGGAFIQMWTRVRGLLEKWLLDRHLKEKLGHQDELLGSGGGYKIEKRAAKIQNLTGKRECCILEEQKVKIALDLEYLYT